MRKGIKYITAAVTGLVIAIGLAACGWHAKTPEEKADYMVSKLTNKLDLTDSQVVELEKLKNDLITVRQDWMAKKEETHKTIEELLKQPVLDQQRVLTLIKEHTEATNEKAPIVVSSVANFYDSLTPEQQATLRDKIAKHRHHWHHH